MKKNKFKNLLLSCVLILSSINAAAFDSGQVIHYTHTAAKIGFILSGITLTTMGVTYGMGCLDKDDNNFQEKETCESLAMYSSITLGVHFVSALFLAPILCSRGVNFYPSTTDTFEEETTP